MHLIHDDDDGATRCAEAYCTVLYCTVHYYGGAWHIFHHYLPACIFYMHVKVHFQVKKDNSFKFVVLRVRAHVHKMNRVLYCIVKKSIDGHRSIAYFRMPLSSTSRKGSLYVA